MVTKVLCLTERYQDNTKFVITDETEWSVTPPDTRNSAARVLVAAKMDENQVLDFIPVVNDLPLTDLSWDITSKGIGAYRFFYIDIPLWLVGTNYIAKVVTDDVVTTWGDLVYHNGVFYRPLVNNVGVEPGVTVGWQTSWAVFDLTTLKDEIKNTRLTIHIHDDIVTAEYELCIVDFVDERVDDELCGVCHDHQKFIQLMKMQFMLDAAQSNNWQQKATRAEVILKEADKKYCCA